MLTERQAPDLEDLAAYIDGRLSGERKTRVEERLLRDEDFYENFLETVLLREEHSREEHSREEHGMAKVAALEEQSQVEQEHGGGGGTVVWWRSWRVMVPLAVAAVLLVVIALPRGGPETGEWVAKLDTSAIVALEGWTEPGWTVWRGTYVPPGRFRPEELAFRLGVRAVELRIALAAGDRTAAGQLATVLGMLADDAGLFPIAAVYGDLQGALDDDEIEALAARAEAAEEQLAEWFEPGSLEARRFTLGWWTEAGRLAAVAGDARVLAGILHNDSDARSVEEIAAQIETLDTFLEHPEPGPEEFEEMAVAFSDITHTLAGR